MKLLIEESVLRQVLDALELSKPTMVCAYQDSDTRYATKKSNEAITTLRSALDAAKCQRELQLHREEFHPEYVELGELRAACQMALDEFESRKRDTEEEGYMHIESVAHTKLREVLK